MVLPARRFRLHDVAISEEKLVNQQKSSKESQSLSNQYQSFSAVDGGFMHILKDICSNKLFGAVYLVNGLKLEGYFCDFDEDVLILTFPDGSRQQMVYHHAIATIQVSSRK